MQATQNQINTVARAAHEANRAYCILIGDTSQPSWEEAPEWQKKSAVSGVINIINNPLAPPSASHENWLKEKLANGWKYGEVKDPEKKEHPCIVDYDQLPADQKIKDDIFCYTVKSMLISLGIFTVDFEKKSFSAEPVSLEPSETSGEESNGALPESQE